MSEETDAITRAVAGDAEAFGELATGTRTLRDLGKLGSDGRRRGDGRASGCVIVWSPDSRFLAIHGEKIPGVAIADVVTLERAQLTHGVGDTPLWWKP